MQADIEGFPVIPGRYGQIEWFDGRDLAVYTNRRRLFSKLWGISGVKRHQTGDREMRAVFPLEALEQVAVVIRAKRRRQLSSDTARRLWSADGVQSDFRWLEATKHDDRGSGGRAGREAG